MKKTFNLTDPKISVSRMADAVRSEIKKYLKRERRKSLPPDADYWAFECKFGKTPDLSKDTHVDDLSKCIDQAEKQQMLSFYIEIIAKPSKRLKKTDKNIQPDE